MKERDRFEELLALELDGELSAAERSELERLLAASPEWEEEARQERELAALMRRAGKVAAPEGLAAMAMARAEAEGEQKEERRGRGFPPAFALLVAASITGVIAGSVYLFNEVTPPGDAAAQFARRQETAEMPVPPMAAEQSMVATGSGTRDVKHSDSIGILSLEEVWLDEKEPAREMARAETRQPTMDDDEQFSPSLSNAAVGGRAERPASAPQMEGKTQSQSYYLGVSQLPSLEELQKVLADVGGEFVADTPSEETANLLLFESEMVEPNGVSGDKRFLVMDVQPERAEEAKERFLQVTQEPVETAKLESRVRMQVPYNLPASETMAASEAMADDATGEPSRELGALWRKKESSAPAAPETRTMVAPAGAASRRDDVGLFGDIGGQFIYETADRSLALTGVESEKRRSGIERRYLVFEFGSLKGAEAGLRKLRAGATRELDVARVEIVKRGEAFRLIVPRLKEDE